MGCGAAAAKQRKQREAETALFQEQERRLLREQEAHADSVAENSTLKSTRRLLRTELSTYRSESQQFEVAAEEKSQQIEVTAEERALAQVAQVALVEDNAKDEIAREVAVVRHECREEFEQATLLALEGPRIAVEQASSSRLFAEQSLATEQRIARDLRAEVELEAHRVNDIRNEASVMQNLFACQSEELEHLQVEYVARQHEHNVKLQEMEDVLRATRQALERSETLEDFLCATRRKLWAQEFAAQSASSRVDWLQEQLAVAQQSQEAALEQCRDACKKEGVALRDRDALLCEWDRALQERDEKTQEMEDSHRRALRRMTSELVERDTESSQLRIDLETERRRMCSRETRFSEMQRCLVTERERTIEFQQAVAECAHSGATRAAANYWNCVVQRRI